MAFTDEIPIINGVLLDDAPTSFTSDWVDCSNYGRVCLMINTVKANAPTSVTYTFEVLAGSTRMLSTGQPSGGTARAYDKMIATGGADAPVANVQHTANTTAFVAKSFEDTFRWFRVVATGVGTTASATFTCTVVLFGSP